jgi:hypothetical protein
MMMEASQPFNNNQSINEDGAVGGGERNLPSEMKHRPKIPRTPNKTERGGQNSSMNQQNN